MSRTHRFASLGLIAVVATGLFLWKYGGTTGGIDPTTPAAEQIELGWHQADLELPASATALPGISGAADGIPRQGTYLVNVWGSWCTPCKKEMPLLERYSQADNGVGVIGLNRDPLLSSAEEIIADRGITYPNVRDEFGDFGGEIATAVDPRPVPSSFLVSDGVIVWSHIGEFKSYEELVDSVAARL